MQCPYGTHCQLGRLDRGSCLSTWKNRCAILLLRWLDKSFSTMNVHCRAETITGSLARVVCRARQGLSDYCPLLRDQGLRSRAGSRHTRAVADGGGNGDTEDSWVCGAHQAVHGLRNPTGRRAEAWRRFGSQAGSAGHENCTLVLAAVLWQRIERQSQGGLFQHHARPSIASAGRAFHSLSKRAARETSREAEDRDFEQRGQSGGDSRT